jgi:hypothetical protein
MRVLSSLSSRPTCANRLMIASSTTSACALLLQCRIWRVPVGVAPLDARRTRREALGSPGSHRPAVGAHAKAPVREQASLACGDVSEEPARPGLQSRPVCAPSGSWLRTGPLVKRSRCSPDDKDRFCCCHRAYDSTGALPRGAGGCHWGVSHLRVRLLGQGGRYAPAHCFIERSGDGRYSKGSARRALGASPALASDQYQFAGKYGQYAKEDS